MPRDSSGNYTLPAGNPVVDGTIIDVNWANSTMQDVAVQMNNLITRNGLLSATAPIKFSDGTVGLPGITWASEPSSGLYRPSANVIGMAISGVQRQRWTTTGTAITGTIDLTGTLGLSGTLNLTGPLNVTGNSSFVGNMNVAGNIQAFFTSTAYTPGLTLESSANLSGQLSPAVTFSASNTNAAIWSSRLAAFGGSLVFATQSTAGGNPAERMRITNDGTALLGTTTPAFALAGRQVLELNGSSGSMLGLKVGDASAGFFVCDTSDTYVYNTRAGKLSLGTNNAERIVIDANGNVGIGSFPVAKLGVVSANMGSVNTTNLWSSKHSTFGPNAASATGACLGLGYDTTNDAANIIALAPGVGWKKLVLSAATLDINTNGSTTIQIDASGSVGINTAPVYKLHVLAPNGAPGILIASGNSGSYTSISVGRTAAEGYFGVAGVTNNFFPGSAPGDAILTSSTAGANLWLATATGANAVVIGTNGAERVRFGSQGYTSIGTSVLDSTLLVQTAGNVASLRVGFGNTSANYYDANAHNFRNGGAVNTMTLNASGQMTVAGNISAAGYLVANDPGGAIGTMPLGSVICAEIVNNGGGFNSTSYLNSFTMNTTDYIRMYAVNSGNSTTPIQYGTWRALGRVTTTSSVWMRIA